MNCECIYYSKGAKIENYLELSEEIKRRGQHVELYPCAISRMEESTPAFDDYDGWGKRISIPKWSSVLFVQGKYHYMMPIRIGHRVFRPWFPESEPIYDDIKVFD